MDMNALPTPESQIESLQWALLEMREDRVKLLRALTAIAWLEGNLEARRIARAAIGKLKKL